MELDVKDSTDSTIFVLFDEVAEQVTQIKLHDLTTAFESVSAYIPFSHMTLLQWIMILLFMNSFNTGR